MYLCWKEVDRRWTPRRRDRAEGLRHRRDNNRIIRRLIRKGWLLPLVVEHLRRWSSLVVRGGAEESEEAADGGEKQLDEQRKNSFDGTKGVDPNAHRPRCSEANKLSVVCSHTTSRGVHRESARTRTLSVFGAHYATRSVSWCGARCLLAFWAILPLTENNKLPRRATARRAA